MFAMQGNQQAFMEAASQIIPVLVLALLADRRNEPGRSPIVLIALLAGVAGEFMALRAVGSGTDNIANIIVSVAMGTLGLAILLPYLPDYVKDTIQFIPPIWRYGLARIGEIIFIPLFMVANFGPTHPVTGLSYLGMIYLFWSASGAIRERKKWLEDNPRRGKYKVFDETDLAVAEKLDLDRKMMKIGIPPEMQEELAEHLRGIEERKRRRREKRREKVTRIWRRLRGRD